MDVFIAGLYNVLISYSNYTKMQISLCQPQRNPEIFGIKLEYIFLVKHVCLKNDIPDFGKSLFLLSIRDKTGLEKRDKNILKIVGRSLF